MEDLPWWVFLEKDFPAVAILDDSEVGSMANFVVDVLPALPSLATVAADFPPDGPFFSLRLPGGEKQQQQQQRERDTRQ
jgi:hypothetical protein